MDSGVIIEQLHDDGVALDLPTPRAPETRTGALSIDEEEIAAATRAAPANDTRRRPMPMVPRCRFNSASSGSLGQRFSNAAEKWQSIE